MIKNTLFERRSIRSYKAEQIKDNELDYVLKAALYAPTGRNFQSTVMVAVQSPELVSRLSKMNADIMGVDSDPFYGAPTVVIVFADTTKPTHFEDGCLAMGNMLNAAYEAGLGSCWIHRARQMFESDEGKALMKQWGVSENYVGIGNCILGYAEGDAPAAAPRNDGRIIKL
ncbi:MAG: nitroreductase [Clostridia bacterium]|nr:nitroreductase [Clostridia bacterium]